MSKPLLFEGLDGGNPLAFMALLGVGLTSQHFCPSTRISWTPAKGAWRPVLHGYEGNEEKFVRDLRDALAATTTKPPFQEITAPTGLPPLNALEATASKLREIDERLPFARDKLREEMRKSSCKSTQDDRRTADLLAAFGSDAHADKDGMFPDTAFRMVRSGDSAGQGLPVYARAIKRGLTDEHLGATLFAVWRYEDDGFSLRWDPMEDQRYALRWGDPSLSSNKKNAPRTVKGANALAVEGLALLPVQPNLRGVDTTGFARLESGRDFFTWPIWDAPVRLDVIRSLLVLPELVNKTPDRETLRARGIAEVYRCERIASNKYYKNFAPAQPA